MTRGGRYYEQLNARRRRQQVRARLKAWLKVGALLVFLVFMVVLGKLVWQQNGKLDALQRKNTEMQQELRNLIERTDKILGVEEVRGYIKDLRPSLPNAAITEIARYITAYSKKYGADPRIVVAMAYRESNFDRNALGSSGERGMLQVLPSTFTRYGYGDFRDWKATLEAGIRYYKWLEKRYGGNLALAVASYNAGPGSVIDRVPDIPVTQRHVQKVMLAYRGMRR